MCGLRRFWGRTVIPQSPHNTACMPQQPTDPRRFHELPGNALVSLTSASLLTALSPNTLRRMSAAGQFPPVLRLSERVTGVRVAALRHWLETLPTAKDQPHA